MDQFISQYLLGLSHKTLEYYFETRGEVYSPNENELLSPVLQEKRGTFVTLEKQGELRGCIGHIEPIQELYKDVIDNTRAAAFEDPRFLPLHGDELKDIEFDLVLSLFNSLVLISKSFLKVLLNLSLVKTYLMISLYTLVHMY